MSPALTLQQAQEKVAHAEFDMLVLNMALPDGNGLDLMKDIRERWAQATPVVVLSAQRDLDMTYGQEDPVVLKNEKTNKELLHELTAILKGRSGTRRQAHDRSEPHSSR